MPGAKGIVVPDTHQRTDFGPLEGMFQGMEELVAAAGEDLGEGEEDVQAVEIDADG